LKIPRILTINFFIINTITCFNALPSSCGSLYFLIAKYYKLNKFIKSLGFDFMQVIVIDDS
jgi:hypothetical protein